MRTPATRPGNGTDRSLAKTENSRLIKGRALTSHLRQRLCSTDRLSSHRASIPAELLQIPTPVRIRIRSRYASARLSAVASAPCRSSNQAMPASLAASATTTVLLCARAAASPCATTPAWPLLLQLASGGRLPQHQPESRSEVVNTAERFTGADRRHPGSRVQHADPWDDGQTPDGRITACRGGELVVERKRPISGRSATRRAASSVARATFVHLKPGRVCQPLGCVLDITDRGGRERGRLDHSN